MVSCGPPPPRACCCNARSSRSSSNSSSTYVLPQYPVLLQCMLLQHPLSSNENASTSSEISAAVSHATAAAVLIPDLTSTHMKRRCNFRSEHVPSLHEVAPAVPSTGPTRARTSCCLRRRDGMECHLYTHNDTKALLRHLHKASYYTRSIVLYPRRFASNA